MNNVKFKKLILNAIKILLCAVIIFSSVFSTGVFSVKASFDEGINYRVGLAYGSTVNKVLSISSTDTYIAGFQNLNDSSKSFVQLFTISGGDLYVTVDGYDKTGAQRGGYNVQCANVYSSYYEASVAAADVKSAIGGYYEVCVAYINNAYRVRIGNFSSTGVHIARNYVASLTSRYVFETTVPGEKTITVYNPYETILFEFESDTLTLGVKAQSGYISYTKGSDTRLYEGVFAFSRYLTSNRDGIQLVNVLPIERYVMNIIPNEIYVSWPTETLKAFAITVRSYALAHLNGYSSYGFDLNSTAQVYGNANKIESRTIAAVEDTAGLVIAYNGKVAEAMYSSSVGGVTVAAVDAYVSDLGYLKAVYTPWEKYSTVGRGRWTKEYTGAQLLANIKNYGYAWLTGTYIASLTVNSYGTNSTYVKSVTVKDNLGNTATINGSDNVRTRLGLNSANFVFDMTSLTYSYDEVTVLGNDHYDGDYPAFNLDKFNIITEAGKVLSMFSRKLKIQTKDGTVTAIPHSSPKANVITGANTSDGHSVYTLTTKTEYISGGIGSYMFAGKGWGHGVGLSQYGIRDLGELGYTYDEMLNAYYTDVTIVSYSSLGIK